MTDAAPMNTARAAHNPPTQRKRARAWWIALAASLAFALPGLALRPGDEAAAAQREAKSLLDAGQGAAALAKAKTGLEFEHESFDLLDLASRCAKATGW